MKTTKRLLGITLATLLTAASGFAQSTTTKPTTPPSTTTGGTGTGGGMTTAKPTTPTTATTGVMGTGMSAATPGGSNAHMVNENASDTAKAMQTLMLQFEAKRDQAIADRKMLIDKLQAAKTDAERQAIITQLRAETQAEKDQQKALGKQMRDELKALRDQRKTGGG